MRMVLLQPKYNVIIPNMNVPEIAPSTLTDPIHESCSLFKGPVFKGVPSDIKIGVAGES